VLSRSVTPTPRDGEGRIDKKKLLAIAKRNATAMLQLGTLQQMRAMSAEELASLKSGGRSVEELIEFCTKLAKKEEKTRRRLERSVHGKQKGEKSSEESSEDDMEMLEILGAVDGGEIRHPFALKERTGITFNIAVSTAGAHVYNGINIAECAINARQDTVATRTGGGAVAYCIPSC
jgi:hypothetical protein